MFWITPPKKWASLIGEQAPLMASGIVGAGVTIGGVLVVPPLRFTD